MMTTSLNVTTLINQGPSLCCNLGWIVSYSRYLNQYTIQALCTVYPKKYAHGFCFAVLCRGYTLTDFPISIRLTSLALWQSNDCPSASKAILMNMEKYFMWIHYERLHNHNKAKHNETVCIFLGIYCTSKTCLKSRNHLTPCDIPLNLYNRNETQQHLALDHLPISEVSCGMTFPSILKKRQI